MTFGERIVHFREAIGLSQKELALKMGVTPTRLHYWEKDKREPDVEMIKRLAISLEISADTLLKLEPLSNSLVLSKHELDGIKKYRALDEHGKEIVDIVLEKESERVTSALIRSAVVYDITTFKISRQAASAGTGVVLGSESFRTFIVKRDELPRNAYFGVPVSGDSMEPTYHNGDILIVSKGTPEIGQVGIYTMDGYEGYVKIREKDHLRSLNPDYSDIPLTDGTEAKGTVIGILPQTAIIEEVDEYED